MWLHCPYAHWVPKMGKNRGGYITKPSEMSQDWVEAKDTTAPLPSQGSESGRGPKCRHNPLGPNRGE